jgi:hypothetical protein
VTSILDLITHREAAANTRAQALREQIATLTDELTRIDAELADLATTRRTVQHLTGHTGAAPPTDATLANTAYQQILAVFDTHTDGLRAKDVCRALGTGTTPKDTEGMRAKLKRLVARQILTETQPGLFTRTPTTPRA